MLRRCALAALVLSLAACGPKEAREAFTESRTPPSVTPRFFAPEGWAWGLLKVGDTPAQRYGVSAPPVAPKATILILTGYDDPAETWFETAADLNRQGYAVWVLERQGQGGSERLSGDRDLGHVKGFDSDVAAVRAMVRTVIRPTGATPTLLLGHSLGGLIAVRAVEGGLGVDGLILSAPAIEAAGLPRPRPQVATATRWARRLGLGGVRAPGQAGWRKEGHPDLTHDPLRRGMRQAWSEANPDLRMGGPSLGWFAAFFDASDAAQAEASQAATPTLLLTASDDRLTDAAAARHLCAAMPACSEQTIANSWHDLPREADSARAAWLAAVNSFARQRMAKARR